MFTYLGETKKAKYLIKIFRFFLYSGRDLNPHDRNGHRILSPACLPIPPPEQTSMHYRLCVVSKKTRITSGIFLSGKRDSNSRPRPWQGRALPTELLPHLLRKCAIGFRASAKISKLLFALGLAPIAASPSKRCKGSGFRDTFKNNFDFFLFSLILFICLSGRRCAFGRWHRPLGRS